ncbi:MAG: hypothetical protein PVF47_13885 [Anaerolineae bacterium]|jgi:hypothetical protein
MLQQEHQVYVVATRRGHKLADPFMLNGDFGWYCGRCPTVVLNTAELVEMLSFAMPDWDIGDEFAVLGLVDLSAVPEEKHHLPLGDDDNPIPLVEFMSTSGKSTRRRKSKRTRRAKGQRQKGTKKRR